MAVPWSLAPNDMAFATVAAHSCVPSVATGKSTLPLSALTQAARAASTTAAATALLQYIPGQVSRRAILKYTLSVFGLRLHADGV